MLRMDAARAHFEASDKKLGAARPGVPVSVWLRRGGATLLVVKDSAPSG